MKKNIAVLVMLALVGMVFAQVEMSAGAEVAFAPVSIVSILEMGAFNETDTYSSSTITLGGFFDATYIQASLGLAFIGQVTKQVENVNGSITTTTFLKDPLEKRADLSIGLLGKYPIALSLVKIFPMLGFEYSLNLSYEYNGVDVKSSMTDDQKAMLNRFWLKTGLGADISVGEKLYVRPTALFAYGLNNKLETDVMAANKTLGFTKASIDNFKVEIGVAIGFKL